MNNVIPDDIRRSSILDDNVDYSQASDEISYDSPANSIFSIFFGMITLVLKVENKEK